MKEPLFCSCLNFRRSSRKDVVEPALRAWMFDIMSIYISHSYTKIPAINVAMRSVV